ncbi:MAG: HdeD family acid-resistance protein [Mesorhizobium sp.]|nr:HdeD family acid-resistance protein [Mesorhizobium sp.]MBL8579419.1 HdeD family acid-resistance protein [Mesorhizobium sp.]
MTLTPDIADTFKERVGELRAKWGWFVALGIMMLVFGGIALGNLLIATVASVYLVGIMMLMVGGFEIAHAFGVKTWGGFFYWLLGGLLYAIAGVIAFTNPALAAGVLTLLLAASLIAAGVVRAWIGFKHWNDKGAGWIITAAIITALCGIVIAIGWPVNSVWVLGMFLAIDMIFQGWTCIALGLALKSGAKL